MPTLDSTSIKTENQIAKIDSATTIAKDSVSTPNPKEKEVNEVHVAPVKTAPATIVTTPATIVSENRYSEPRPQEEIPQYTFRADTFQTDTFIFLSKELPEYLMRPNYMDSCRLSEILSAPIAFRPIEKDTTNRIESEWNELKSQLVDVRRTDPVVVPRHKEKEHISLKTKYAGYDGNAISERIQDTYWFTPLLFVAFFLCGLSLTLQSKSIEQDRKEFFSVGKRYNSNDNKSSYSTCLLGLWAICTSIFGIFLWENKFGYAISSYETAIVYCTLANLAYIIGKKSIAAYFGYVFVGKGATQLWNKGFNYTTSMAAIVLLAVNLCLSFGPTQIMANSLTVGLAVLAISEIAFLLYLLTHFLINKLSFVYLFLYLCTFEILPAIALYLGYSYLISLA